MSKGYNIIIELSNTLYRFPINRAVISLYDYPATITDGTVFGTPAISTDGTQITGILLSDNIGRYKLYNIPTGKYTAIATGVGINAQVLVGYEDLDIGFGSDVTGSDIPYKDNTNVSIADKLDNLDIDVEIIKETGATSSDITLNGKGGYSTIQSAITDSTSGDTIYVRKSNYNESLTVKDGIHIHMETGVVVTSPTDTACLTGTSLTSFKLTGGGRFVNNGIQPAVSIQGSVYQFPRLSAPDYIELNGGKQLMYSNNIIFSSQYPYYYSEDGVNYERSLIHEAPIGLKTIGRDGTNRVFGYKVYNGGYIDDIGFYYSTDNGENWTLNNSGISPSASDSLTGFYVSSISSVFLAVGTSFYKSSNNGQDAWVAVNTGLPSLKISNAFLIGNYGYVEINKTVYRADVTAGTITWSLFDTGLSGVCQILRSNGTDTLYIWNSTERKIYSCKVTETSTWTEIVFPLDLLSNSVTLYYMEWYQGYLYCSFDKIGIFRYYEGKWISVLDGAETNSFATYTIMQKINEFLYIPSAQALRYFDGNQWSLINGGANIHLEFDSAENLGVTDEPNTSTPSVDIKYANLKLRCREIYSKKNVGLSLLSLYGKIDARVDRIETGIPGMPNGESGSTALLTCCDGYFEANEIIVNNVGHAISSRGGIMHFNVKKIYTCNNHPSYQVQTVSQILGQSTVGTTTTIEFDEIVNARGEYQGAPCIVSNLGTMNLKGRRMVNETDASVSSTSNLNLQVDLIENIGNWCPIQVGGDFPYKTFIKNTATKSLINRVALFNYDKITGTNSKSITLENCSFESVALENDLIMQVINYSVSGFTPVEMDIQLKGINTFNAIPNDLITFIGEGILTVNGQPLLFEKPIYLAGNELKRGSWRFSATLDGQFKLEYTNDGSNWVEAQAWNPPN